MNILEHTNFILIALIEIQTYKFNYQYGHNRSSTDYRALGKVTYLHTFRCEMDTLFCKIHSSWLITSSQGYFLDLLVKPRKTGFISRLGKV